MQDPPSEGKFSFPRGEKAATPASKLTPDYLFYPTYPFGKKGVGSSSSPASGHHRGPSEYAELLTWDDISSVMRHDPLVAVVAATW